MSDITYQDIEVELSYDIYHKLLKLANKENITIDELATKLLKEYINDSNTQNR